MTTLPAFIADLARHPSPVLTVYSADRVELNGPVLARWLAKVANLLGTDLASDLFGDGGEPGGFRVRAELWQDLVWSLAARAMGWERLPDGVDAGSGDLLLVNEIDEDALSALEAGARVLAQPRDYLAFSWSAEALPEGALDALAEVMAHSDALEVAPPPSAPVLEEVAEGGAAPAQSAGGRAGSASGTAGLRLCVPLRGARSVSAAESERRLGLILGHWLGGATLVLVDSDRYSPEEAARIAEDEGAVIWD